MIRIVERLRAGTPVRTFKIDLPPRADGQPEPAEAYLAAARKRPGANFKYPNDRAPYTWRVRELDTPDPVSTT
jgi:hypothetical protein